MTIVEAIKKVMQVAGAPMTHREVYSAIVKGNLYEFHSANPEGIVRAQIRRHCVGLDFPSAVSDKHFVLSDNSRYFLATQKPSQVQASEPGNGTSKKESTSSSLLHGIQAMHAAYVSETKKYLLDELKRLEPTAFEVFSKRLLEEYGFRDMHVTKRSSDGGIDGHGALMVGLARLKVAFQCKRWINGNIQRPDVDQFRGAIQGKFEQGIFLTTSAFSRGAIEVSIQSGAVPIVLLDGSAVVELMIQRRFGVQTEELSIPTPALDLILTQESK